MVSNFYLHGIIADVFILYTLFFMYLSTYYSHLLSFQRCRTCHGMNILF